MLQPLRVVVLWSNQ